MELPVQPLLSLVEDNANGLKLLLKNYIDLTVERQFDQLKNSIVEMIATGQIGPQSNNSSLAFTQTTFTSGQSISDPKKLPNLHHSNDHLSITHEQNIIHPSADVNALVSFQSPLNTTQVTSSNEQCPLINTSPVIKRECLEDSSITIPINVQCNDAPNDEDKEQSNNADIEVNDAQNGQVPIDEVKEEYDDDENENEGEYMSYDDECENCVKGICQLNQRHLVREINNTDDVTPNDIDNNQLENNEISSLIQGTDSQDEFEEEAFDDEGEDHLLPTSQQNYDHSNASIVPSTMYSANNQLTIDQITLPQTNQLQTSNKQTNSNLTSPNIDFDKDYNYESKEVVEDDDDETSELVIEINQGDKESSRLDEMQRVDQNQSLNGQSQTNGEFPIQCDEPAIRQLIPSTSGLIPLSDRNRILMFGGDVQSSGEVKSDKRKSATQSSKALKKVKHQKVEEIDLTEDDDDGKDKTKAHVVTLGVNCTKLGCMAVLNSVEMWKEHLSSHGQVPYKQLYDNARTNQHGQTEYPCTECDLVYKYKISLIQHWRFYHQTGKFKCSACEFVANRRKEVVKHKKRKCRDRPRSFSFQSILQMNGTKHSGPTVESN